MVSGSLWGRFPRPTGHLPRKPATTTTGRRNRPTSLFLLSQCDCTMASWRWGVEHVFNAGVKVCTLFPESTQTDEELSAQTAKLLVTSRKPVNGITLKPHPYSIPQWKRVENVNPTVRPADRGTSHTLLRLWTMTIHKGLFDRRSAPSPSFSLFRYSAPSSKVPFRPRNGMASRRLTGRSCHLAALTCQATPTHRLFSNMEPSS
ncbi:hypothetical protein CCUS01_10631 [Colletotrichum cuscutae]|uniref:Uncharacterized protein n=1 Tax=Colletotrichum cuscutae TaxID=1209917 RepID=A0AAI9XKW5_9PEZI|nr:hypothetical protein CCUS01_10631 [Colletotrichum cuscutae]